MAVRGGEDRTIAPGRQRSGGGLAVEARGFRALGSRSDQEDSFRILDLSHTQPRSRPGVLALVADGMGGLSDGAAYSEAAVSAADAFERLYCEANGDATNLLLRLLMEARGRTDALGSAAGAGGTTFLAAVVLEDALRFLSVGDSRIYLARGGGVLPLTREHSYGAELDEKAARGELSFVAAGGDPQRRALTSYLGMDDPLRIDRNTSPVGLLPGDSVLLLTDGVFGTLTDGEIAEAIKGDGKPEAALERAVARKAKPGQDNYTAVVITCR